MGGNGVNGDLFLFPFEGDNVTAEEATIHLDGANGNLIMGGPRQDGDVILRDAVGNDRIHRRRRGQRVPGGNGVDGDLLVFADSGDNVTFDEATIHLNGQTGDIVLATPTAPRTSTSPAGGRPGHGRGDRGQTARSTRALPPMTAASRGSSRAPAISVPESCSTSTRPNRLPVALVGKVFCKVDAGFGAIDVGDLLTTSPNSGHAMKAATRARLRGRARQGAPGPSQGRG